MNNERILKEARTLVFLVVAMLFVSFASPSFAATRYAVVIAVSKFDDKYASDLSYVDVDAETTVQTLKNLGFEVFAYCEESADVEKRSEPTRENVLNALTKILPERVEPEDSVFIYVSTHGQVSEGRTYLLTKDSKLERRSRVKPSTALSAAELRDAASKLRTNRVFLAFDACESAGTRGAHVYGKFLDVLPLEDDSNVATLASCATNQLSYPVTPVGGKTISHFTYWLNEGMKGYADENSDGEISTDELANYVQENVAGTCDLLIASQKGESIVSETGVQTPYVVAPKNIDPFVLTKVKPRDRESALNEISEQIATRLYASARKNKAPSLTLFVDAAVRTNDFSSGRAWDAASGFCDSFCEKLKERVKIKLSDVDVNVEFATQAPTKEDATTFRCEFSKSDDERAYKFSGLLSDLKDADGEFGDYAVASKIAFDAEVMARLGKGVVKSENDAKVWIEVVRPDGSADERIPKEVDGTLWVPLDVGEKYRIVYDIENDLGDGVGIRILVDGRNTIKQYASYVPLKRVVLEPSIESEEESKEVSKAPSRTVERAAQVEDFTHQTSLDEARFWVQSKAGRHTISGFYQDSKGGSDEDKNATYEPFVVASNDGTSEQSDKIGSIQAAFYNLTKRRGSGPQDIRTVPTEKKPTTLTRVRGLEIASGQKPFAYFSIRYASSDTLKRRYPKEFDSNTKEENTKEENTKEENDKKELDEGDSEEFIYH